MPGRLRRGGDERVGVHGRGLGAEAQPQQFGHRAGAARQVVLEAQLGRRPRGQVDLGGGRRRGHQRGAEVGVLGLGDLVDDELTVDVHLAVADGGEANADRARLGRGEPCRQLHRGRPADRGVSAEPDQRARAAVLGEQLGAVRVQEPGPQAGPAGDRVGHLRQRQLDDAFLDDGTP